MATIGQQLLTPEAGWKRYDDRDTNISYVGTWTPSAVTGYYNNTNMDSNSTSSYYEFWFKGTKLRIIDGLASNRSADVKVTIDGVTESYSAYATATTRGVLVYEKTGLTNGFHKVVVKNNTSNYMTLDAIDIDEDGIFRPSYNKFLILSNEDSNAIAVVNPTVENLVPIMTSNTAPSGVASSSVNGTTEYRIFNRNSSGWFANANPPPTTVNTDSGHWIQYDFGSEKIVGDITLTALNVTTNQGGIKDFSFYGTNDGINFEHLYSDTHPNNLSKVIYNTGNKKSYRMYRLVVKNSYYTSNPLFAYVEELELIEGSVPFIKIVSSIPSEKYYITHGMNKNTAINLNSQMTNKVFIEQNPTTVGIGKVFSRTIDTTKTSIKKVTIK